MLTLHTESLIAQEAIFRELNTFPTIASLSEDAHISFENSLCERCAKISQKATEEQRGWMYAFFHAFVDGWIEGRKEKMLEIIHNMRASGLDDASISKYTGISLEELSKIV